MYNLYEYYNYVFMSIIFVWMHIAVPGVHNKGLESVSHVGEQNIVYTVFEVHQDDGGYGVTVNLSVDSSDCRAQAYSVS